MPDAPINRTSEFLPHTAFWIRDQATAVGQPPLHKHEYFQVYVNLAGRTEHVLGATVRPILPGTLSFIMPLRVHCIRHVEPAEFFVINFRRDFLRPESRIDLLELEDVSVDEMPELAPFLYQEHLDFELGADELAEVRRLCLRMQAEHDRGGFYAIEFIRADLFRLIGLVCRRYQDDLQALARTSMLQGSRRASLARVSRFMREHLSEPITLADAAAAAYLSTHYLAHLLKRETGRTFTEILADQRMDLACRMLTGSSRPIAEIAASVGFPDEAYFARRFRQLRGVTPSAYRGQAAGRDSPAERGEAWQAPS
ncbi:AraC family transcriptional regulator [Pigmentiphaga sp. GD03639]|jgi:AraC-like DNA-binding protein|uniref:AraC family transcriptional regulator n=1 Tax=Pigmentiphaga daeguensis TaxID=414049 RepID=A0ABN1B9D5_9BURK|nr:AraC family transcriptional regulator [Pigmentiphaga sp. GD03639]MDH2239969.1 AraC family transcriptional regulator [Pigmentiphaga sp. GD03639]